MCRGLGTLAIYSTRRSFQALTLNHRVITQSNLQLVQGRKQPQMSGEQTLTFVCSLSSLESFESDRPLGMQVLKQSRVSLDPSRCSFSEEQQEQSAKAAALGEPSRSRSFSSSRGRQWSGRWMDAALMAVLLAMLAVSAV